MTKHTNDTLTNENSVLRLVTASLMKTSEEWQVGKTYLALTPQKPQQTA